MTSALPPDSASLPAAVALYLEQVAGTTPADALPAFTAEAVVIDDGAMYRGSAEITGWLTRTVTAFEYTTTLLGAETDGSATTVRNRLEGNFPGGVVELRLLFLLDAATGLIRALTIAP